MLHVKHDDLPREDLPRERLDQAVRTTRSLCERFRQVDRHRGGRIIPANGVPDRSALRGLLNFAQSTPSTDEAVLFVRYQATRLDQREFLTALAEELDAHWAGSIGELRRFLGILVRAGSVAHAAAPPSS